MGGGEVSPSSISSSGGGGVDCTMCNMVTTVQYVLDGVKKGSSVPESLYSCFELEQQLDIVSYEMPPGYSHDIISKLPPLDAPIHGDFFRISPIFFRQQHYFQLVLVPLSIFPPQ